MHEEEGYVCVCVCVSVRGAMPTGVELAGSSAERRGCA